MIGKNEMQYFAIVPFRLAVDKDIQAESFLDANHKCDLLINLRFVLSQGDLVALELIAETTDLLGLREGANGRRGEDGQSRKLLQTTVGKSLSAGEISISESSNTVGYSLIGSKSAAIGRPLLLGIVEKYCILLGNGNNLGKLLLGVGKNRSSSVREKGLLTLKVPWDKLKICRRLDTNSIDTRCLKIIEGGAHNRGVYLPYVATIDETST